MDASGWGTDRVSFSWRTLLLALFVLVGTMWLIGCSAPSAPTVTPPPAPTPTVTLRQDALASENTPTGLRLTGTFTNIGDGCARAVSGELRISTLAGVLVSSMPWTLDPAQMIRPQQQAAYTTCCFVGTESDYNYSVRFAFTTVTC